MFTDGLDENALNWLREGLDVKPHVYPSENISPNLVTDPLIYNAARAAKTKSWGLPPSLPATKLSGIHYHSGLLSSHIPPNLSGNVVIDVDDDEDDDDESVGSAPDRISMIHLARREILGVLICRKTLYCMTIRALSKTRVILSWHGAMLDMSTIAGIRMIDCRSPILIQFRCQILRVVLARGRGKWIPSSMGNRWVMN